MGSHPGGGAEGERRGSGAGKKRERAARAAALARRSGPGGAKSVPAPALAPANEDADNVTKVWRHAGGDWWAVARRPYHLTLAALVALEERERVERLEADADDLRHVYRVGYAMAASKENRALEQEQAAYLAALATDPGSVDDASTESKQAGGLTPTEEQAVGRILRAMFGAAPAAAPQSTEGH